MFNDFDKIIMHLDMDCFFAAIEMRDNPKLKNLPIAVGGKSKRSVLCTANYEARKYGVRSAMSSQVALKKCPDLKILPPRFEAYKDASDQVFNIMRRYSKSFQPLSLDEAFLDLSLDCPHFEFAEDLAREIQKEILSETGLTSSIGVSHLKFLAKIASDHNKPHGVTIIHPKDALSFISELPIERFSGVGQVMREKLHKHNIYRSSDLLEISREDLHRKFGKMGNLLWLRSRGIDHSRVKVSRSPKSISIERTFEVDLNLEQLKVELKNLIPVFHARYSRSMEKYPNLKTKSLMIKLKLSDHRKRGIERSLSELKIKSFKELQDESYFEKFSALLESLYSKKNEPVRLLGLGVRVKEEELAYENPQLSLLA
ncbi:MAG: DNA polymerase IV [Bacteriovoracaceae bacterium]